MDAVQNNKIDLSSLPPRLRHALRRFWLPLLILCALCPALAVMRASHSFTPRYESTAVFSVTAGSSSDDIMSYAYYYNNAAAEQLALSFPYILESDLMRDMLRQELGASVINGSISATSVADTNMFVLTVRSANPGDAYRIITSLINIYPQVAYYIVDGFQMVIKTTPTVPSEPYNGFSPIPSIKLGLLAALCICAAVLLTSAMATKTVYSSSDLSGITNLPVLASMPKLHAKKHRSGYSTATINSSGASPLYVEAVRTLRVKLLRQLGAQTKSSRVIIVTSTLAGEGKSTVSTNLSLSLAADGKKVVLIDADLRKPSIGGMLNLDDKGVGLGSCLNTGQSPLECLVPVAGSTLSVLTGAGAIGARRAAFYLDSPRVKSVISLLAERFEYIVFDTPPSGIISDAGSLCRYADGIVYVVRYDYAKQGQISDSLQSLADKKAPITGCVLNAMPRDSKSNGYGKYGSGYGKSGYGYGLDKTSNGSSGKKITKDDGK